MGGRSIDSWIKKRGERETENPFRQKEAIGEIEKAANPTGRREGKHMHDIDTHSRRRRAHMEAGKSPRKASNKTRGEGGKMEGLLHRARRTYNRCLRVKGAKLERVRKPTWRYTNRRAGAVLQRGNGLGNQHCE